MRARVETGQVREKKRVRWARSGGKPKGGKSREWDGEKKSARGENKDLDEFRIIENGLIEWSPNR